MSKEKDAKKPSQEGYQPLKRGYQPTEDNLNTSKPPQGGSGVSSNNQGSGKGEKQKNN